MNLKKWMSLITSATILVSSMQVVSMANPVRENGDFQFELTEGGLSTLQCAGDPTGTNFVRNDRGYRFGNLELNYNNTGKISGYMVETDANPSLTLHNSGGGSSVVGSANGGGAMEIQGISLADFTYEVDITPISGGEAGLAFRAGGFGQHPQGLYGYYLGIFGNKLQLLKTEGEDFPYVMGNSASYPITREYNKKYRIKIEAVGANIKIYLDDTKVIDVTDTETPDGVPVYTEAGSFGMRTYNGSGRYSNIKIHDADGKLVYAGEDLEANSKAFGGDWKFVPLSMDESAGYRDTDVSATLRVVSGQETGLVFKASMTDVDSSDFNCYFVSVNANSGKVYLMKPKGRDYPWLADPVTPKAGAIVRDKDYKLEAKMVGNNIKVLLDGELLFDYTDSDPIQQGYAGLMAYNSSSLYTQFDLNGSVSDDFKGDMNWVAKGYGTWAQMFRDAWTNVKTQNIQGTQTDTLNGKQVQYKNLFGGLSITQKYETKEIGGRKALEMAISLENSSDLAINLGDLALPVPFNNAWEMDQETTQTKRVLPHYFVSQEGSFLYASHPDGTGPYLIMTPGEGTKLEYISAMEGTAYLSDFMKVYVHSGYTGPQTAGTWRQEHTTGQIPAGESTNYSFVMHWAEDLDEVREILFENSIDVEVIPGMTIPEGLKAKIAVRSKQGIRSVEAEYAAETTIESLGTNGDYEIYEIGFAKIGENKITVNYGDTEKIYLEFFYTKPIEQLLKSRTEFISENQQVKDSEKVYDGLFSQWSMEKEQMTTPDNRMGQHMYAVSGSDDPTLCKAPTIAQLNMIYPDAQQIADVEYYLENFVWGGLQRSDTDPQSEFAYGMYGSDAWWLNRPADSSVPDLSENGNGGHGAGRMWRTFDYTHMVQLYYNMYTIAKNYPEMVNYIDAEEYLERAYGTAKAFFDIPYNIYMKGWSFTGWSDWAYKQGNFHDMNVPLLIDALEKEGKGEWADEIRDRWENKVKYMVYDNPYPFGSEMAYDTTAFESTHAVAKYGMEHDIAGGENDFYDKNLNGPGQGGYRSHTDVDKADVKTFMEREIKANKGSRGMIEPAYYQLGTDMRGMPYSLSYMTQLGGWGLMDYAQYYSDTPAEDMRIAYASYLAPYMLFNTGEDYPWYGTAANEGALAWAFQPLKTTGTWLGFEEQRGPWRFDGENDSGIAGGMRAASTALVDDPIFGLFAYGAVMQRDDTLKTTTVQPQDGINQRFHVLTGQKLHMVLNRDNFSSVTVNDDRTETTFVLNNLTANAHNTELSIEGLASGQYDVLVDGVKAQSIEADGKDVIVVAVPEASAQVSVTVKQTSAHEDVPAVSMENIDNISGEKGTQLTLPVSVENFPTDGIYKAIEGVVQLPQGVQVNDVALTFDIGEVEFDWNVSGDLLRFAFLAAKNTPITVNTGVLLNIDFELTEDKEYGSSFEIKATRFNAKTSETSKDFDLSKAVSILTVVEEKITAAPSILYQADGTDVIPEDKKAVSVVFTGIDTQSDITLDGVQFYYNEQRSNVNGQMVYVALVDRSVTLDKLADAKNYAIKQALPNTVMFGDESGDGDIDAQDALNTVCTWLRKITNPSEKQMLAMNVNADGKIDTGDAIEIVDFYVAQGARVFPVVAK